DQDYLPNLEALLTAVADGRLDEDDVQPDVTTIRMADDERQLLVDLIKGICKGTICPPFDPIQMQFFIYRPESLIYADGAYKNTSIYHAIIAGPPIDGLHFNKRTGFSPLSFEGIQGTDHAVAIGIVDDGIAFAHERFRSAEGASRIYAIWIQEVERRREQ